MNALNVLKLPSKKLYIPTLRPLIWATQSLCSKVPSWTPRKMLGYLATKAKAAYLGVTDVELKTLEVTDLPIKPFEAGLKDILISYSNL